MSDDVKVVRLDSPDPRSWTSDEMLSDAMKMLGEMEATGAILIGVCDKASPPRSYTQHVRFWNLNTYEIISALELEKTGLIQSLQNGDSS